MSRSGKWLVCVAAGIVSAMSAGAISADNPFQGIVDRNVFGLRAPPPPPSPPEPPKPPLPPINLTGIMTMGGRKRALLEAVMPAKPPDQPKKSFYTLGEDERDGEVQVLKIDDKGGNVQINLMGTVTNLSFATKMPTVAPLPPGPGQPPPGIPSPVSTGVNPGMAPGGFNRTLPGRPLRTNPTDGAANTASGLPGGATAYGQPQANAQGFSQNDFTKDETALILEAERERLRQSGDPRASIMPLTHLTPNGAPGTVDDGSTAPGTVAPTSPNSRRGRSTPFPQ